MLGPHTHGLLTMSDSDPSVVSSSNLFFCVCFFYVDTDIPWLFYVRLGNDSLELSSFRWYGVCKYTDRFWIGWCWTGSVKCFFQFFVLFIHTSSLKSNHFEFLFISFFCIGITPWTLYIFTFSIPCKWSSAFLHTNDSLYRVHNSLREPKMVKTASRNFFILF